MSQPIEIIVPRLGWSMEQGAFVAWHKKDGEFVEAGDALFSIEGDKAIQEIESIDSGILRIVASGPKPGDPIRVGDVLGYLVSAKAAVPKEIAKQEPGEPRLVEAAPVIAPPIGSGAHANRGGKDAAGKHAGSPRAAISPRALRVATELGVDWSALKGSGRTGRIRERDIRAAASSQQSAPALGRVSLAGEPTVLVTGGCGFIGTWVVRELLERGLRVAVLDADEKPARWARVIGSAAETVAFVRGSLLNRELLAYVFAAHGVTHVIHLAAILTPACQADPWEGCQLNVLGSVALFEEVRKSPIGVKGFSYASSIAVFDDQAHRAGLDESCPPTFYGAFKRSVELIAAQYWRHFGISSLGIRPQVAYGPERDTGLTAGPSLAARAAAAGESFCIGYTGIAGYDYVEDIAHAFVRGTLETPSEAQCVDLPGERVEVSDIVAAINAAVPGAAARLSIKGPPIPTHSSANPQLISGLFPDWSPTSLAEGMRKTVEFYQKNPHE
jgi:UDP-glucose 4-epimerase